jgi:DNA-binding CsgD family transcriptional regulator
MLKWRNPIQLYRLTSAEARLASLLAEGLSSGEAADELGLTRNTTKTQAKAIYSKTGVRTHSQFVKLVSQLSFHSHPLG